MEELGKHRHSFLHLDSLRKMYFFSLYTVYEVLMSSAVQFHISGVATALKLETAFLSFSSALSSTSTGSEVSPSNRSLQNTQYINGFSNLLKLFTIEPQFKQ